MRNSIPRLVGRRLVQAAITILLMTLLVHASLSILPGDPIRALFGFRRPDPDVYAALQNQYRFDEPWAVQYVLYVRDLVTGNWGYTFPGQVRAVATVGAPIADVIKSAIPASLALLLPTLAIQLLAGTAVGIRIAADRGRRSSRAIYLVAVLLLGIPVLALAYFLQSILGWQLGWLPVGGTSQGAVSYLLPVVSLSLTATALVALLTRSQLQEVLGETYIKAAHARAIPRRRILNVHALRLSVMPAITFTAANFGQLFTGLIIVEGIFGIPGVGNVVFEGILQRDHALLITSLVLVTATVSVLTLIADVLHLIVDPRIRADG